MTGCTNIGVRGIGVMDIGARHNLREEFDRKNPHVYNRQRN